MGQFYETIPESLMQWIRDQKMFWVATAPLSASGHVNISPKGGPYFGVLDDKTFWYMDLTGSGSETISHLYEANNARITVMFTAFEGLPRIVRLFGHGRALEIGTAEFAEFVEVHGVKTIPGSRAIILVDIHQVGSSCGYSVPYYDFKDFRTTLNDHFAKKVERFEQGKTTESMEKYWAFKNAWSIDGLPGLEIARRTGKADGIAPIEKMVGPQARRQMGSRWYGFESIRFVLVTVAVWALVGALYTFAGNRVLPWLVSV